MSQEETTCRVYIGKANLGDLELLAEERLCFLVGKSDGQADNEPPPYPATSRCSRSDAQALCRRVAASSAIPPRPLLPQAEIAVRACSESAGPLAATQRLGTSRPSRTLRMLGGRVHRGARGNGERTSIDGRQAPCFGANPGQRLL